MYPAVVSNGLISALWHISSLYWIMPLACYCCSWDCCCSLRSCESRRASSWGLSACSGDICPCSCCFLSCHHSRTPSLLVNPDLLPVLSSHRFVASLVAILPFSVFAYRRFRSYLGSSSRFSGLRSLCPNSIGVPSSLRGFVTVDGRGARSSIEIWRVYLKMPLLTRGELASGLRWELSIFRLQKDCAYKPLTFIVINGILYTKMVSYTQKYYCLYYTIYQLMSSGYNRTKEYSLSEHQLRAIQQA